MSWLLNTHVTGAPIASCAASDVVIALAQLPDVPMAAGRVEVERSVQPSGVRYSASLSTDDTQASATNTRWRVVRVADVAPLLGRSRARRVDPSADGRLSAVRRAAAWRSRRGRADPAAFNSPWATSMRKPSAPASNQNRKMSRNSSRTSRVVPVEVGLLHIEQVQVPLAVGLVESRPCGAAELRHPVVRWLLAVGTLARQEVEAGALWRAGWRGDRGLKPDVLVARCGWARGRAGLATRPRALRRSAPGLPRANRTPARCRG